MTRKTILLAVVALLIAYGSLYPFHFAQPPAGIWERLLSSTWSGGSRGDIIGNIGLFVPWGLIGMLSLRTKWAFAVTLAIGFILAFGLQIIQAWVPSRTPALYDGIWNMAGCLGGMLLAHFISKHQASFAIRPERNQTALWLLLAWIVTEWLPLVPSLDLQLIKNQLKGLLAVDSFDIGIFALHFAISLLFGELLSRRFRLGMLHSALLLPAVVAAMLAGKLLLVDTTLTASGVAGYLGGIAGWWILLKSPTEQRSAWVVGALIAAYSLQALTPFALKVESSSFEFLPFAGMLKGSMLDNARSLASTLLLFFSVLLLLRDTGSKTSVITIGLALWVLLLESLQMFIEGRSASVTESILVLIAGLMVSLIAALETLANVEHAAQTTASPTTGRYTSQNVAPIGSQLWFGSALIVVMVIGLKILLAMPSVPYNVRELFRANGSVLALAAFVLALIWIGAGAAWMGGRLSRSSTPALLFGPITLFVALISLALLWSGVTSESVSDIVGSSNRYWFVINNNLWGDFWRELFLRLNQPSIINFLETCVRYWALYTPLIATLGLLDYALARDRGHGGRSRVHGLAATLALAVCAGMVFWLCKAIAFDWSSTDNLNELIARDGEWGLGGGGYLYGLLFLICLNAILIVRVSLRKPGKLALIVLYSLLAIPAGWWLLNQGLDQQIEKYGNIFSGVQFLLGPDRQHLLSSSQLLLRWSVLQALGTVVIALGLWFGHIALRYREQPVSQSANRQELLA